MNRLKSLLAAMVLIMCFASMQINLVGAFGDIHFSDNELPFLPAYDEEEEETAPDSNENQDNNPSSGVTTPAVGGGGSRPTTKPVESVEPPEETTEVENNFSDIKPTDWFYNDVLYVYKNNLMTGTGEDTFSPDTTLNRAMMITILHRIANDDAVHSDTIFDDVEKNSWYENAVNWGYENKIVTGMGENTFAPMSNLTREQLCVMLYQYTKYIGAKTAFADITSYSDYATVSAWAKDAVSWAVQEKIITGKGNNNLAPRDSATRAEAAAVIKRYTEKFIMFEGK